MTIDLESLRGHTPGPWKWWTSCSFRRLSAQGDGDVLCAVTQSDGHPDVHIKNGGWEGPDGRLIEIAPTLLAKYERLLAELTARRARDAEVEALVAAAKRANGDHTAPHDCYATGPSTALPEVTDADVAAAWDVLLITVQPVDSCACDGDMRKVLESYRDRLMAKGGA